MRENEHGLSTIELIVSVLIMSGIALGAMMTTFQVIRVTAQSNSHMTALQQVQNAGFWITRDVQTSRNVTAGVSNGFPISLKSPVDISEENDNRIEYVFDSGKLKRQLYDSSDNLIAETMIAAYIDTDYTTFSSINTTLGHYRLTVRASREGEAVTRVYDISQRLPSIE